MMDDDTGEEIVFRPRPSHKPKEVQDLDPGELDAFINKSKTNEETFDIDEDDDTPIDYGEEDPIPRKADYAQYSTMEPQEDDTDERADLLNKLTRMQSKGFKVNCQLKTDTPIHILKTEYKRLTYGIEVEASIKFQRRALMAVVTGLEFLNDRFDPFDLALSGWSETMYSGIEEYDTVFEELYQKYNTKVDVAPEIKLMMMVGGSAMMFHMSKSMFKSIGGGGGGIGGLPGINPDLMANVMKAMNQNNNAATTQEDQTIRRDIKPPSVPMGPQAPVMGGDIPQLMSDDDDDISDIVSVSGSSIQEIKEIAPTKRQRKPRKPPIKKNEITI